MKFQDNKTPLHYAAERGSQSVVQALLDKGASVDCVDKVWIILQHVHYLKFQDNKTSLHFAVERGSQSVAQALLDKGANVDCMDIVSDYIIKCTLTKKTIFVST